MQLNDVHLAQLSFVHLRLWSSPPYVPPPSLTHTPRPSTIAPHAPLPSCPLCPTVVSITPPLSRPTCPHAMSQSYISFPNRGCHDWHLGLSSCLMSYKIHSFTIFLLLRTFIMKLTLLLALPLVEHGCQSGDDIRSFLFVLLEHIHFLYQQ